MITLSKPISSGQAQAYHKQEFANAKENYYTEGERVRGEWQGQLAARWGLHGEVQEQQFVRLAEGQHPETGEQLVRHQTAREYVNAQGDTVRTMEHRAGWDATFSAPKSVSLTAWLAATTACARPTGRACGRRLTRWRSTCRPASAATSRRRRRAHGPSPSSSMTAADPSMVMPRRSCTRTR